MTNTIDILSQNKASSSEVTTSSIDKEVPKDKPSLFDSLLKDTLVETNSSKEVDAEDNKNSKETLSSITEVVNDEIKNESLDIEEPKKVDSKIQSTLLDRLVIEAKSSLEIRDNNEQEIIKPSFFDSLLKNTLTEIKSLEDPKINQDEEVIISKETSLGEVVSKIGEETEKPLLEPKIIVENDEANLQTKVEKLVETEESVEVNTPKEIAVKDTKKVENDEANLQTKVENLVETEKSVEVNTPKEIAVKNTKKVENDKSSLQTQVEKLVETEESIKVSIPKEIAVKDTKKVENDNVNLEIQVKESTKTKISDETVLEVTKIVTPESKSSIIDELLIVTNTDSKTQNKNINSNIEEVENINSTDLIVSTPNLLVEDVKVVDTSKSVDTQVNDKNLGINTSNSFFESGIKTKEKKSLMDLLIEKNMGKSELIAGNESFELLNNDTISKDFVSSMYLGSQKNLLNNQLLFNKNEAMNVLKNATSVKDIEKSAELLDLGLENVDFTQSVDIQKTEIIKKQDIDILNRRSLLDNLLNEKNVKGEDIRNLITKSIEASSALLENSLNLSEDISVNVNAPLSYNIQSKIIGAKQQMSTMMSDIARQMYENYKPPVSVFRINLNPLELGSIAIMMKSDKNNALTISMNISNNTTLEALVENQNVLRNSLNKTFDENTKFNLDFSSSNQNNNQSSNNQNNNNQSSSRFENQGDTQTILQMKEENKDREEKVLDYM